MHMNHDARVELGTMWWTGMVGYDAIKLFLAIKFQVGIVLACARNQLAWQGHPKGQTTRPCTRGVVSLKITMGLVPGRRR